MSDRVARNNLADLQARLARIEAKRQDLLRSGKSVREADGWADQESRKAEDQILKGKKR